MTSGNVTNIGPNLMVNGLSPSKDDSSSTGFLDVMNKNVIRNDKKVDAVESQSNVSDKKDTNISKADNTKASSKDDDKVNDTKDNKTDKLESKDVNIKDAKVKSEPITEETTEVVEVELPKEVVEMVNEVLDNFANEVAKVLENALDITEDELTDAMATLNVTFADLLNPKNVTELMVEVTNVEDSVSLVLNEDLSDALAEVRDLATKVLEDTGLEAPVIKEVTTDTPKFTENLQNAVEIAPEFTEAVDVKEPTERVVQNDDLQSRLQNASQEVEAVDAEPKVEQNAEKAPIIVNKESNVTKENEVSTIDEVDEVSETTFTKTEVNTKSSENSDSFAGHNDSNKSFTANVEAPNQNVQMQANDTPEARPVLNRFQTMQMITEISEQARVNITKEVTSLEMILNPESLGKIYLNVSEKQGALKAQIVAQNEIVKEALENQVAALKENLNKAGVKVEAVEVSVGTHEFEKNLEEEMHEKEEQSRQQEEQAQNRGKRTSINLNNLDEMQGLMSEEDRLVAQMMKDHGNSVNYMA